MANGEKSETERDWMARAAAVLPGAGFGNFPADIVLARGDGARVWDISGNAYVDYLIGSGPMMVGHRHPDVIAAVERQLADGLTFFADSAPGIALAERITAAVPCAEKLRYVSTGGEADMYAIRAARAVTGREKILKFEGGYHGMSGEALMSLAPKRLENFPNAVPDSAGIPESVRDSMVIAPFNDAEAVRALLAEHGDQIAAVIVEPLQRIIPPEPGFLEMLRAETERRGIVLIFDEVVTGFRLAWGGAQEKYGVVPDLCTLGKVIGGGFPLAAIAGRDDIMALFDKSRAGERFLFQIGTLSGNPVASAAGMATMDILARPGAYDRLRANGTAVMTALRENFARVGVPIQIVGDPVLFDVVFTEAPVRDYRGVFHGDKRRAAVFNAHMRANGILKPDSKFYISLALTDEDLEKTAAAIAASADAVAAETVPA